MLTFEQLTQRFIDDGAEELKEARRDLVQAIRLHPDYQTIKDDDVAKHPEIVLSILFELARVMLGEKE